MRDYGKVYSAFWLNEEMRAVSEDGRMLALYLMTSPHGNMLGCFRLTNAYAADDLQWESERVSKGFDELFKIRFAYRCERSFWVFLRQYLKWNQFENPNVGKAAAKMFDSLPCPDQIKSLLFNALREYSPYFPEQKLKDFESLSIPFENPFELSSKTRTITRAIATTEPEPIPSADGGRGIVVERRSDVVEAIVEKAPLSLVEKKVSARRGDVGDDVRSVFAYWQQKLGHERAQLDAKRLKAIKGRLKDGYTVADLCLAVDGCSRSPYHMGQNDSRAVYDDIELICRDGPKVDSFIKRASESQGLAPSLQRQAGILKDWI